MLFRPPQKHGANSRRRCRASRGVFCLDEQGGIGVCASSQHRSPEYVAVVDASASVSPPFAVNVSDPDNLEVLARLVHWEARDQGFDCNDRPDCEIMHAVISYFRFSKTRSSFNPHA